MSSAGEIGLYVHVPFCQHKCSYCDFYSVVRLEAIERFVDAVCHEIELRRRLLDAPVTVVTMFWGGGTPSLLSAQQAERIARAIFDAFTFADGFEWTIEANPGTLDAAKLRCYRQLGVNRISFGVQSFNEVELRFLERIHSADDAVRAVEEARAAGFTNINIDLMFALPGQTAELYRRTLERACQLAPEHISAYSLIYEPGTPLYAQLQRGAIVPLTEDEEAALYRLTVEVLATNGYEQYEVSNFARGQQYRCRHNLLYWRRGQYIGFGPSAHSHWKNARWSNVRSLHQYLAALEEGRLPVASTEVLTVEQQQIEAIFLGLRAEGIDLQQFRQCFGLDVEAIGGELFRQWCELGLARRNGSVIRLTAEGYAVCDELTLQLLEVLDRHRARTAALEAVL